VKILIFSDIHGDTRALEKLVAQPADIYIAAGDLSTFGKDLDRCGEIMKPLGEKVWVLPGNHESHGDTRSFCERFGFFDFHRQIRALKSERGTTQWAGQILELDDFIFEKRSWVPGSGWPFLKSELAPYYKRAAELEGLTSAPSGVEEIWRQLGMRPPSFGPDLISAFL